MTWTRSTGGCWHAASSSQNQHASMRHTKRNPIEEPLQSSRLLLSFLPASVRVLPPSPLRSLAPPAPSSDSPRPSLLLLLRICLLESTAAVLPLLLRREIGRGKKGLRGCTSHSFPRTLSEQSAILSPDLSLAPLIMIGPSAFKSVFNNTSATTHLTVRSSSIAVRSEVDGVLVACDAPRRGTGSRL